MANPEGGVLTFVFNPNSSTGPAYAVTTMENSATIPDLSAMGMGLPCAADYAWFAAATHSIPSVDGAVTGDGYLLGYFNLIASSGNGAGLAPESDGRLSATDTRSLPTQ